MEDCLLILFAITLLLGWSTFCPQTILTLLTFFVIIVADLIFVIICRWSCGALSAHVSTHDVNLASAQLPQMFEAAFEHFELYHSPSSSSLPLIDVKISSLQLWKDVKFPITSFLSTIFPVTWFCCWLSGGCCLGGGCPTTGGKSQLRGKESPQDEGEAGSPMSKMRNLWPWRSALKVINKSQVLTKVFKGNGWNL